MMDDEQRIEIGEGYHLTPIRRRDKAAYLHHFTDPSIAANMLRIPYPYTEADADRWLDWRSENARVDEHHFAIREPGGYLIGAIGPADESGVDTHAVEIGYWLAGAYRGRGLMVCALRTYARYAFSDLRLLRLYAMAFSQNIASQRVLEKAGFCREGLLRGHHLKDGRLVDAAVFGLLATDVSVA